MKKVPVYILLFLYTAVQLKPLAVVIQDAMAHTFWRMQHMATVHFENGRYHLHADLKDASEKENKAAQQKAPSSEKSVEIIARDVPKFNFSFTTNSMLIAVRFPQQPGLLPGYAEITSPPPKVA